MIDDNNSDPLPPYQPSPNMPAPPSPTAPPRAPTSGFDTVTPGSQPIGSPTQGGIGSPVGGGGFPPPQKKSKLGLILGLVGLCFVLLVIAAIVGFVLFIRNAEELFDDEFFEDAVGTAEIEDTTSLGAFTGSAQVDGEIGRGNFDVVEVELLAQTAVVITALRGDSDVDPVLQIRNSDGDLLDRNDDADIAGLPDTFDSQIVFVANSTDVYSIEVSDFLNDDAGSYRLTIEEGSLEAEERTEASDDAAAALVDPQGSIEIDSGSAGLVRGTVGAGRAAQYNIDLSAGEALVITVESESSGLDPRVELLLDGAQIGVNDDALDSSEVANALDSRLVVSTVVDGQYQIVVDGFAGSDGDFTMTIERN